MVDTPSTETATPARLVFIGDERLADGFRLIGFEAHENPAPETVERLLRGLLRARAKALVVVDDALMAADIPSLQRIRREGGRIVVVAVPALGAEPPRLSSAVADRLDALFGAAPDDETEERHDPGR
ncbi:V-type ATP synthase subunit F [Marichromatium gracile]|uniref:ATPase n=1 Tax=Marichromatium gracile TaxID=1048 RepID=A0ABR5VGE1_MARGR|nr:V-type ATP synthase subunit F [Marichromatium gracile]KXX64800.1 ATPase [Marichromatium gracile]